MTAILDLFSQLTAALNGVLWHPLVMYLLLAMGLGFTIWSRFSQYRSLTHGTALVLGKHEDSGSAGAISHFQALSAALSATVGVGNIGGVALGIAIGGPGAVFWMWVVGVLGMAIKTVEVTLSMIYRKTEDPQNPHGGPMWVASRGLAEMGPGLAKLGKALGWIFCFTTLIATFTGGNFFQAWAAGTVAQQYFGIPSLAAGVVLCVIVAMVILGGISRIGAVAGRIVPFMCIAYLLAAIFVVIVRMEDIPGILSLIFTGAFGTLEPQGAFVGGTLGWAFSAGLQRAFFSNEAGQGSSPMAHAAARTDEPAREGLVAGLEPFIDTLVVCTLTAMVILMSGSWSRQPDLILNSSPVAKSKVSGQWTFYPTPLSDLPPRNWQQGEQVDMQVSADRNTNADSDLWLLRGQVDLHQGDGLIHWGTLASESEPKMNGTGLYLAYDGPSLTAYSFDLIKPGLGKWLVCLATWLFAISTLISWSYYGEQSIVFMFGEGWVKTYKIVFCGAIVLSTAGLVRDTTELNNLTMLGTGAMLFVNVPITLIFAAKAMGSQRAYFKK